jgi:benzoate-CoA ligase family protein
VPLPAPSRVHPAGPAGPFPAHDAAPRVELPRDYNAAYDLLQRHVDEGRGDRVAVIDDDGSHTYRAVAERAMRAAGALQALGVQPEQRVALCMVDSVDFVATFLGAIALGAVPVPLNTLLTADDYAYLVRDMRAAALIGSDALLGKLGPAAAQVRAVAGCPSALGGDLGALPSWRALIDGAQPLAGFAATTPDDVAFWLYSSGSTGKAKGAMHLHGSLVWTAALYAQPILGITPDDVVYSAAKLFFAYGLGNALTFPFSVGATAVLSAERPTPATVMRVMRARQPTIFGGVPTLFAQLLADPALSRDATSQALRISMSAGEALPRHIGERWRERMGSDILDGIGSTEMLHIFLSNRPGDVRYGTTGRPVPGYDLELRGDDDRPVGDGEEGSLWVRGPSSCIAYWNDRARSLAAFHGPWTRTGDRYSRGADGTWTYGGRADDMLKVGGIWVSPFEVESALAAHPAVLEAAVVGAEDSDGLTKPKAFVVLRDPGAVGASGAALIAELQSFVKTTLAPFKYPRWIEIVAELPKTATGKIQRFKLRAPGGGTTGGARP